MIEGKKAVLNLSVRFIVIVILLLVLLMLLIFSMRTNIERASIKLEEQIVIGAPGPEVEITNPQNNQIFGVGDKVSFESFAYTITSKTKIVGYFWDFDSDGYIDKRGEKPDYTYYEPGDYNVTLKVLNDLGGIGSDSIIVRVFTNNEKRISKYEGNPMFFISSEKSPNPAIKVDNWRNILKIIPITRWFDREGDHTYDFVVVVKEDSQPTITADDIKDRLQSEEKNAAVVFDVDPEISINGYNIRNERTDDLQNYFSYWESYDSVVVVDFNNHDGALIAALFAAYYNSPIVFMEDRVSGDYSDYDSYLLGKKFYIIDTIPDAAHDYYIGDPDLGIGGKVNDWVRYNSEDLRNPSRRVNRIVELRSKLNLKD